MATGVETAGLVLGTIPLILAGLEFYAKGIAVTKRYWKFKQACKDLCKELRTEGIVCRNSLQRILIGVVHEKDMAGFLENPGGDKWKEQRFETRLKERLGTSYNSYIETIDTMKEITDTFVSKLKLDVTGKTPISDEKSIREHYKRLKFSLQKETYDDLIARLNKTNTALDRMTTQTISIENEKSHVVLKRESLPNFRVIQEHAAGFYSALATGWKCACLADHSVNLRLELRDKANSDDGEEEEDASIPDPFRVVFHNKPGHVHQTSKAPLWTWEEADVRVTLKLQNLIEAKVAEKQEKGVRFKSDVKDLSSAPTTSQTARLVEDLCGAMGSLQIRHEDECLSFSTSHITKQQHGIRIYPLREESSNRESCSITSLRQVLGDSDFTWRERLNLAVILASSVLQLHKTPWLNDDWGMDNIYLLEKANRIAYDHPFVSQRFGQSNEKPHPQHIPQVISLVIRNQTLYALGVSLIELHYGKSIRELHKPEDGPLSPADSVTAFITEWNTVNRLVDRIYNDVGHIYGDAVRRCVKCDFDRKSSSLDDEAFQKVVYSGVVSSLQDTYRFLFKQDIFINA